MAGITSDSTCDHRHRSPGFPPCRDDGRRWPTGRSDHPNTLIIT